jgi:hypothetical protein
LSTPVQKKLLILEIQQISLKDENREKYVKLALSGREAFYCTFPESLSASA